MRIKGTQYETIEQLPAAAKPVSLFARSKGWAVGYVYIKHDRHFKGYTGAKGNVLKGEYPGYIIRCFQGTNYVIPQ